MSTTEPQADKLGAHPNNKQLHGEVLRLRALVETKIGKSAPHVAGLQAQIAELERTSKRHPTIGRQLTLLHARVNDMQPKVARIVAYLDTLDPDNAGMFELKLNKQKLETMLKESETFDELTTEFAGEIERVERELGERIDTVDSRVTELDGKVDENHDWTKGQFAETNRRVGHVTNRVFNLESTSLVSLVVGIAVGVAVTIIAFLVMLPVVHMTPELTLNDGVTTVPGVPDPQANNPWNKFGLSLGLGAILGGVAMLITLAITTKTARRHAVNETSATQERSAPPVPRPATPVNSSTVEDETPTRPYDRTPVGASSGTH